MSKLKNDIFIQEQANVFHHPTGIKKANNLNGQVQSILGKELCFIYLSIKLARINLPEKILYFNISKKQEPL